MQLTADAVESPGMPGDDDNPATPDDTTADVRSPTSHTDFNFIPKSLAAKCRRLIETYHAMNGYACLPDMLWQPGLRDFIEMHRDFRLVFKRASTARSAKRANEGFVLIATTVLSLEVLANDFATWSSKYPSAKRRARAILQEFTLSSRTGLMDRYLYPRSYINPAFINALAPNDNANPTARDATLDVLENEAPRERTP
jgi:hypothetical protein